MKKLITSAAVAGLMTLTACGGGADDKAAENIEAATENQSDMLEDMAANTSNAAEADVLDRRAAQVEEQGEDKAEAIDENDGPTTNSGAATTNRVESNISGM